MTGAKRKQYAAVAGFFFLSLSVFFLFPRGALSQGSQSASSPVESCAAENKTIEVLREEISYLQKDVIVREEKIRELRGQVGEASDLGSVDNKTLEEASAREEELSRGLRAAEKELAELRQELSRSKQDNARLEQEAAALKQNRDRAAEVVQETTRLEAALAESKQRIEALTAQRDDAAGERDELARTFRAVQAETEDLRAKLKEKPSEKVVYQLSPEQTREFNRFKEDISAKEKELIRLRDDKVSLEEELDNARSQIAALKKQNELAREKDERLQETQVRLDEARRQADCLISDLDAAKKNIATLEESIARKPEEKIIYKSSPEQDEIIKKLKNDISNKEKDISRIQAALAALEKETKVCQGDMSLLQQSLASCREQQRCDGLKREISECNRNKKVLQSRAAAAEEEIEKLSRRLAEKPKENIVYKPSPVQEQTILTLEKRIASKDETIETLKKKVSQKIGPYAAQIKDLQCSLEEKEREIKELTAVIKEIVTKIKASSGDLSTLSQ